MTDSTLLDANASLDSLTLKEKDKNPPPIEKKRLPLSNTTHISKTDPEATLAFKSGTPRTLKYKAHVTSDSVNRIILAIRITTSAVHDSVSYLEQLNYVNDESDILQGLTLLQAKRASDRQAAEAKRALWQSMDETYGF